MKQILTLTATLCIVFLLNAHNVTNYPKADYLNNKAVNNPLEKNKTYTLSPNIEVYGNNNLIADGANNSNPNNHTNFGGVGVNGHIVRVFTIKNTNTAPLTVSSITITGAQATQFSVGSLSSTSPIVAGSPVTVTILFSPTSTGAKTARLHIFSDDINKSDYDFEIRGSANSASFPTLGIYSNTTIIEKSSTLIVPSAVPTNTNSIAVTTTPDFTGSFAVNQTNNGEFKVYNAGPVGVYTITVTASGNGTNQTSTTFLLTVKSNPISISSVSQTDRCGTGKITMVATASAGTINWYDASNNLVGTGATFTTPMTASGQTNVVIPFYVEATDGISTSPKILVNATWFPDFKSPTILCHDKVVILDAAGNDNITINDLLNNVVDNCTATNDILLSMEKWYYSTTTGDFIRVKIEALDASGNSNFVYCMVTVMPQLRDNSDKITRTFKSIKTSPLSISPNPATDIVNINLKMSKDGPATLVVHDMLGKIVYQQIINGQNTHQLQTGTMAKGMYFITLLVDNERFVERVILK
jgi:Secretion system C-terminal sorting domain/Abnormal spindle-like microcephaly-assoc'd, ASPM-SPD-2-Hydin